MTLRGGLSFGLQWFRFVLLLVAWPTLFPHLAALSFSLSLPLASRRASSQGVDLPRQHQHADSRLPSGSRRPGSSSSRSTFASSTSVLFASGDSNLDRYDEDAARKRKAQEEERRKEAERMRTVRALQETFYSSPDTEDQGQQPPPQGQDRQGQRRRQRPIINPDGTIESLPLWRVPWTELPGRANALIVHEARYTNMFERIVRAAADDAVDSAERAAESPSISDEGYGYFGHLRLPGGSESIGKEGYELLSWEGEIEATAAAAEAERDDDQQKSSGDTDQSAGSRSAVIGSLLRILDYRRLGDGKMLLLIQSLERFVVTKPIREVPYSIAEVQVIPDLEELLSGQQQPEGHWRGGDRNLTEAEAARLRARAVAESTRWRGYEFDTGTTLPVRGDDDDDLTAADVAQSGTALLDIIPLVPYSSSVDPAELLVAEELRMSTDSVMQSSSKEEDAPSLEKRLIDGGILLGPSAPDPRRRRSLLSKEELERELWVFMDVFVRIRNMAMPPELLGLLPRDVDGGWPSNFILDQVAADAERDGLRSFVRVPENYPAHRRRRRLSFVASTLTDNTPFGRGMPQILLEIHSTRDRLEAVLDVVDFCNTEFMGEFS